ncbi:hypothetical protein OROMI_019744 [Orobanche minor]
MILNLIEHGQLGVILPLMERLQSTNNDVKDTENQVAIVNNGGLIELIKLFNAQDDGVRKAVRKILFSFSQNEIDAASKILKALEHSHGPVHNIRNC